MTPYEIRILNRKLYEDGNKYCSKCKFIRSLIDFNKCSTRNYGKHSRCKFCDAERKRIAYNKEKNYGTTKNK